MEINDIAISELKRLATAMDAAVTGMTSAFRSLHDAIEAIDAGPQVQPDPVPVTEPVMGDFLYDGGFTMTLDLFSRSLTDADRQARISRSKQMGYNAILLYGANDDSGSEAANPSNWPGVPKRPIDYVPERDFDHFFHWLVQCRVAGLAPWICLWPNYCRKSLNDNNVYPPQAVIDRMKKLVALGATQYEGAPIVRDYVLKLEADDEWSIEKINQVAAAIYPVVRATGGRLWYHNQTTNVEKLKDVDWQCFNGIAWQYGRRDPAGMRAETLDVLARLTWPIQFVGCEYTLCGSQSGPDRERGDAVLGLMRDNPRIVGVLNGCTTDANRGYVSPTTGSQPASKPQSTSYRSEPVRDQQYSSARTVGPVAADIMEWPQSIWLHSVTVDNGKLIIDYDRWSLPAAVDAFGKLAVGNVWCAQVVDGKLHATTVDWLGPNVTSRPFPQVVAEEGHLLPPMRWDPAGGIYGFFVSSCARANVRSAKNVRSSILWVNILRK